MHPRPWTLIGSVLALFLAIPLVTAAQPVIDDFEGYAHTGELQANWAYSVSLDTTTPSNGGGTASMRYGDTNVGDHGGRGTERTFSPALDLSGQTTLSVWFRRDASSVLNTEFHIGIWSGSSGCGGGGTYSDTDWHLVTVDLTNCPVLDVSAVTKIDLTIANMSGATGDIWGNFDDITTDGSVPVELLSYTVE